MSKKKFIILIVIAVIAVIGLAIGSSYALFTYNLTKNSNFKTLVGKLELSISDTTEEDRIVINNLAPKKDSVALTEDGYTFTVTNTGTIDANYIIHLDDIIPTGETKERISDNLMRANLYNSVTGKSYTFSLENNRILDTGILIPNQSVEYTLRMWLDYSAGNDAQNKYYAGRIRINSVQSKGLALLSDAIKKQNKVITTQPDLTTISTNSDTGLYKMSVTNGFGGTDGDTYYFRGNVTNNYVSFAGFTWRIVRINEDGTVRLIMQDGINNNQTYKFNEDASTVDSMYYSNSNAKTVLDNWYQENIVTKGFGEVVATGNYFCEEAKVTNDGYTYGLATPLTYNNYVSNLKCSTDGNNYGFVNSSIGLITYDELNYAGAIFFNECNYYLNNASATWTMSPIGIKDNSSYIWNARPDGSIRSLGTIVVSRLRPVINLKADAKVTGNGTSTEPYVVVMDENSNYQVSSDVALAIAQFNKGDLKDVVMCDQNSPEATPKYVNCKIYNTIDDAIADRDKGLIVLTSDITRTSRITIAEGKDITLDLNGKKIEKTTASNILTNNGNIVINDSVGTGKIINSYTEGCGHGIFSLGNTIINGGTIETINDCGPLYVGTNSVSNGTAIINGGMIKNSGNGAGVLVYSSNTNPLIINGGSFENNGIGIYKQESSSNNIVMINDGTFLSNSNNAIRNNSTGTININGGTFTSNSSNAILNNSTGTINITQTDKPIYITSLAQAWRPAIVNSSTGTINITANQANQCTSNASDTTSGLCVYAYYNDSVNNTGNGALQNNGSEAKTYIDGGTFIGYNQGVNNGGTSSTLNIKNAYIESHGSAILNHTTGIVNVCSTTTNGGTRDLTNSGSGTINYSSDMIFTNGTNAPNIYNPTGTITEVATCPISE